MDPQFLVIYIWKGKAYMPLQAQAESGFYVLTEPVFVSELERGGLLRALRDVLSRGHPRVPDPPFRGPGVDKDPLLAATGARSWKELARSGFYLAIAWTDRAIRIDRSKPDDKGRWIDDPEKVRLLSPDTTLEDLVTVILDDIHSNSAG